MNDANRLTPKFRHVRLLLAREKGHPSGDRNEGYDLVLPLDVEGRIDPSEWKAHQAACRVRRFRPGWRISSAVCGANPAASGISTMSRAMTTTR